MSTTLHACTFLTAVFLHFFFRNCIHYSNNMYFKVYIFDTCRKSIQFNSIFRPVAGGEAWGPRAPLPEIFRFELISATKLEFCLLKWTAVHGSYSFQVLSTIERLCTVVLLCNWNCVKERNRIFALPKTM